MLASSSIEQKERKTRKTHHKVRTGCVTCKIRRKKCDEARPACQRCVSTGRICDGYDSPTSVSTTPSTSDPDIEWSNHRSSVVESTQRRPLALSKRCNALSSIPRNVSKPYLTNQIDVQCFDYFRCVTGPTLGCYFDSSIWPDFTMKVYPSHPVVLKAAAALGAVHRRFELGISREAFEYCAIADRLQREALKAYAEYKQTSRSDIDRGEILMVTAMLFVTFEAFQDNYESAINHMVYGLGTLWNRPTSVMYSETYSARHEIQSSLFYDLFKRLEICAAKLFGRPPRVLASLLDRAPPPIPPIFSSMHEALDYLFTELDVILRTPVSLWLDSGKRAEAQNMHVSRLLQWSAAYSETVMTMPKRTALQIRSLRLLKLTRNAIHLLLYLVLFLQEDNICNDSERAELLQLEPIWDADRDSHDSTKLTKKTATHFLSTPLLWRLIASNEKLSLNLTRICMLADTFLDDSSVLNYDDHSIAVDTGIGPPRLPKPGPTSSSKTRHLVRALLPSRPNDDAHSLPPPVGADNSIMQQDTKCSVDSTSHQCNHPPGIYAIAERLSCIEEHAVLAAIKYLLPHHKNTKWVDVTCFLEEGKLIVSQCRSADLVDGTTGDRNGLIWTQEWLQFER